MKTSVAAARQLGTQVSEAARRGFRSRHLRRPETPEDTKCPDTPARLQPLILRSMTNSDPPHLRLGFDLFNPKQNHRHVFATDAFCDSEKRALSYGETIGFSTRTTPTTVTGLANTVKRAMAATFPRCRKSERVHLPNPTDQQ